MPVCYNPPVDGHYHAPNVERLYFALAGKPDTAGWRELFGERGEALKLAIPTSPDDWKPIDYNARIYPKWAVKDYWYFRGIDTGWEADFIKSGIDLPQLEELLKD